MLVAFAGESFSADLKCACSGTPKSSCVPGHVSFKLLWLVTKFYLKLEVYVHCRHASLLEEFSDFQQQWMSFLLQKEYQNHQIATRKQMLEKLAGPEENSAGNILEAHRDEEARLKVGCGWPRI